MPYIFMRKTTNSTDFTQNTSPKCYGSRAQAPEQTLGGKFGDVGLVKCSYGRLTGTGRSSENIIITSPAL